MPLRKTPSPDVTPLTAACIVLICSAGGAAGRFVVLTSTNNPAYNGSNVSLTCTFHYGRSLFDLGVNISLSTHPMLDEVRCDTQTSAVSKRGVIRNTVVTCDTHTLTVSLVVARDFNTRYSCLAYYRDGSVASGTILDLNVYVEPTPPQLQPTLLNYNVGDRMIIACFSFNGIPPSELYIQMTQNSSGSSLEEVGLNLTSLLVIASKEWHNAIVTCRAGNHLLPGMVVTRRVTVNERPTGRGNSDNLYSTAMSASQNYSLCPKLTPPSAVVFSMKLPPNDKPLIAGIIVSVLALVAAMVVIVSLHRRLRHPH